MHIWRTKTTIWHIACRFASTLKSLEEQLKSMTTEYQPRVPISKLNKEQ